MTRTREVEKSLIVRNYVFIWGLDWSHPSSELQLKTILYYITLYSVVEKVLDLRKFMRPNKL